MRFYNFKPSALYGESVILAVVLLQLTGTWYASRWYLPQKNNITDEIYDEVTYSYKKPGNPKVIVDEVFSRLVKFSCPVPFYL